jgi:tetratricopeptide (TPR) repeat protein
MNRPPRPASRVAARIVRAAAAALLPIAAVVRAAEPPARPPLPASGQVANEGVARLPQGPTADAGRVATYRRFRELFDAGKFAEALPVAEKLVADTEALHGADSRELVNPLANVAATHFRLGNGDAAEAAFLRSVRLIEGKLPGADRMLIRPLHGLGESYLARRQYGEAAVVLKRAVDLSRNLDGLFNVEQLEYLDPLIEAYIGEDRLQDAEKESQYAFRIAETGYGRNDLRMLDPLDRYARWYEFVGRYTTARGLHARALQLAEGYKRRGSVESVPALRGLARTYYLEFIYGPEETEEAAAPVARPGDLFTPSGSIPTPEAGRLNPEGERALRLALEALGKAQPVDRAARGQTLVELGDWYLIGTQPAKALDAYRQGWADLVVVGPEALKPLTAPRRLAYRPPPSSILRARPADPEQYDEKSVELKFNVGADGKVADVVTVQTDAPASIERGAVFALRKARYAPRLENGEPVSTEGVTHRERVLVRRGTTYGRPPPPGDAKPQ